MIYLLGLQKYKFIYTNIQIIKYNIFSIYAFKSMFNWSKLIKNHFSFFYILQITIQY
jgi:hypothetical protein